MLSVTGNDRYRSSSGIKIFVYILQKRMSDEARRMYNVLVDTPQIDRSVARISRSLRFLSNSRLRVLLGVHAPPLHDEEHPAMAMVSIHDNNYSVYVMTAPERDTHHFKRSMRSTWKRRSQIAGIANVVSNRNWQGWSEITHSAPCR